MQNIVLTAEEIEFLHQILQHQMQETDVEVHRTDSLHFKEMLQQRRHILQALFEKVSAVQV